MLCLVGHTGQRFTLDASSLASLDDFKQYITSHTGIQPRSQILLTAQGKQVRTQTLLTENEIFVFDSGWLNGRKAASPTKEAADSTDSDDFDPGAAPDTIANQNDLQSWQNLFRLRKSWAAGLLNGCGIRAKQAKRYQDEQAAIERSLGVAVASLQQHIKSAEKQFLQGETWANEVLQEQQAHADNWEHNLGSLRNIPARADFTRFIEPMPPASGSRRQSQLNLSTLQGFVDVVTVKQAAAAARTLMSGLTGKVDKIRGDLDAAAKNSDELLIVVDQISHRSLAESASEPAQLIDEIQMVVNKMAADFEHVQSSPKTPQQISAVSKMALLHTRSYVPNLVDYCGEMNDLVRKSKQQRDTAADVALEHMRTLSAIESQLAKIYQEVKELDVPEDQQQAFVTLQFISRLPSVYGQLLVESVRRREWVAKMKRDSGTLQEEVAAYQDEEEKRRKKWMRTVDDIVLAEALQSRVLGIELTLQNEGGSWPMTTRDELAEYHKTLNEVYGQGPVTDEIDQAIKDLDKPTRKQIKHARAFKNGSMHEAAFGDTSLFLRGDEQHKSLRDANVRLEEEVKAQKSRVRKLEDLLHRQTQVSRASTGDVFALSGERGLPYRTATPTGQMDDSSRNNSLSKRRPSVAQASGLEEKKLAKRVVDLEAELQTYKDDLSTRKTSDAEFRKQVEEATSTKKDLMENMEAQQREFASERRHLEKDLAEAREKLEECENEIERLVGSRDGIDEEISRLKEDAAGHAARAATEHDARNALERRLRIAEETKVQAEQDLQRVRIEQEQQREAEVEQLQSLATAHAHLSPDANTPSGLVGLASALEELARKSAGYAKDLEEAIAFAKSENESLWSSNERQKSELNSAAQRQTEIEEQARIIQEKLDSEQARAKTLTEQLGDEQEQLLRLRNKFADGETGSEVLRQRVSEEESKARQLTSDLAEAKSHINSLDVELMRLNKKHKVYQTTAEQSGERLQRRTERAKEVSHRLYGQNLRLGRLLERLGLVITYQGETMSIERASKLAASTTIESHMQLSRQISVTSPSPTRKPSAADADPPVDLRSVHWPDALTAEEETSQYEAFLNHISRFDLDVFADAVTKRVKDFEYTAKKYSKESKESTKRADAYKERAVKLRSEAHSKIAVRDFKEGDLALFLPTRGGQVKGAWAAFNIGCPHYFLAEREGMRLGTRDFIVARIQKVEQKVVDLSGQRNQVGADGRSLDESSEAPSSMHVEDDNPFDLSDGLTWWMVHAVEERGAGAAPTTPGLGKSTVASANVDAKGSIRIKRSSKGDDASKHLNKSLDSRRSSSNSKKGVGAGGGTTPTMTNAPTLEPGAAAARQRSGSKASSLDQQAPPRPLPSQAGLGIMSPPPQATEATSSSATAAQHEQIRKLPRQHPHPQNSHPLHLHLDTAAAPRRSPSAASASSPPARARSKSPSKSVRSLQKHLEPQPAASSAKASKGAGRSAGWESLFSAEVSLESSPAKERKGTNSFHRLD